MDLHFSARYPISITSCHNGCICLQFGMTMIHLSPSEFERLVATANEALTGLAVKYQGSSSCDIHH